MPGEIARTWFVPGEGIDRHVISADIQRYLGNDATVRPGDQQGQQGYWIKAYRNLTSAMISDLRADSVRWRQEQRQTGTREPYVGSRTYQASSASSAAPGRRDGDSPSVDTYGAPSARGGRGPVDAMQIDTPAVARGDPRYGNPAPPSRGYPPENGGYQQPGRDRYQDQGGRPSYPQDQPMSDAYGARAPVSTSYGGDPRYAPAGYQDPNAGMPSGYYMPVTSGYPSQTIMAPSGQDPRTYQQPPYGGQPPPNGRDSRDHRDPRDQRDPRDPRYGQDYNDPRYAYPSPAATVSSVAPREREPISSPQQPSPFGAAPPQYDQYGRPVQPPQDMYGSSNPGYAPQARDPNYGRDRPAPAPAASDRDRDSARRRRLH